MKKKNFNLKVGDNILTTVPDDYWKMRVIIHIDIAEEYGKEDTHLDDSLTIISWEVLDTASWWSHVKAKVKNWNTSTYPYAFGGECTYKTMMSYISKHKMYINRK